MQGEIRVEHLRVQMETLAGWWHELPYRVVFSGAGMSTESGLPDFRSPQGMWKKQDPRKLASISALRSNTREFYDFYRMRLANLHKAQPHEGHLVLGRLQKKRMLDAIITQNVDSLHQRAGATRVIELHGNLREAVCLDCRKIYSSSVLEETEIPRCEECQGLLKPGVILFGESLPYDALRHAEMESKKAKLFVVIGSSLEVSPANYFPELAIDCGARLVLINKEPTHFDSRADLVIREKAGKVLTEIEEIINKSTS